MHGLSHKITSPDQILELVRRRLTNTRCSLSEKSERFKFLVIEESNHYDLDLQCVHKLADYLEIYYEVLPPKYRNWIPRLSNLLQGCVRYTNPHNSREYLLQVQGQRSLGATELFHHTEDGFTSSEVFQKLIPYFSVDLEGLKSDLYRSAREKFPNIMKNSEAQIGSKMRGVFAETVNKVVNKSSSKLDPVVAQVIYAYFEIEFPRIEGICPKCFNIIRLPSSGFGLSFNMKTKHGSNEMRVSPNKLGGFPQQTDGFYMTNTIKVNGRVEHVKWQPVEQPQFVFERDIQVYGTHIPYMLYDQNALDKFLRSNAEEYFRKFSPKVKDLEIPICKCGQNGSIS